MDLIDDPAPGQNVPELSVSELAGGIKRTLEGTFGRVRVKGEIGRLSRPASGHLYFDLKDEKAVIASVAWKGVAARLKTLPEEGMEVVATGKITTFGPQSKYQLIVDDIRPAGLGALMVMLEKRKRAFEAEGLFAPERKKPLPYLPEVIGVVTSPSGAVIRDILHRLRDRFPRQVLIWPVVVQGEKCASDVAAAIRGFNALPTDGPIARPDVLIVARGGGSLEDLWGFNEELPVRAVAESNIPVISAVGHETDTTLIDYVADRRAPTPTAAAEIAVPVRLDLMAAVAALDERRVRGIANGLAQRRDRLRDLGRILPKPDALLGERQQRFDGLSGRLDAALLGLSAKKGRTLAERTGRFGPQLLGRLLANRTDKLGQWGSRLGPELRRSVQTKRMAFDRADRLSPEPIVRRIAPAKDKLEQDLTRLDKEMRVRLGRAEDRLLALDRMRATLGYKETLGRGFVVVRDADGQVVSKVKSAKEAGALELEFDDGRLGVVPAGDLPTKPAGKRPKSASKKSSDSGQGQGSLF